MRGFHLAPADVWGTGTRVDTFSIELPADAATPRLARQAVAQRLGGDARCDDLLLCVSEVVTNAVLHARSASVMSVHVDGDRVRVEVVDGDATLPVRRAHDPHAPTGRGLRLLDDLTVAWGAERRPRGKVVWFELDLAGGHGG